MMSTVRYGDEDGHVTLLAPATSSEEDAYRIELAFAARAGAIVEETGLFIVCGALLRTSAVGR